MLCGFRRDTLLKICPFILGGTGMGFWDGVGWVGVGGLFFLPSTIANLQD